MKENDEELTVNGPGSHDGTEHHHHHHHDDECDDPGCTEHHHHHHHHDDECDDPGCTEHHHHHHHHDDECDDPNCTDPHHHHHNNKHEDLIKDSLIMSRTRSFAPESPVSASALREMGEKTFIHLGDILCVEGVIAGHLKGVIETQNGSLALSLTRAGVVDVTELGGWKELTNVESYSMTVNIMSIVPAELSEDDLFIAMK